MTNTQQDDADLTATLRAIAAPLRELIASLRQMEATFKQEREFIQQHRPHEQVGDFPSLDGIETKRYADLEVLKVMCVVALKVAGQRANEVQAQLEEAERIQAEQNMTEMEMLKRAVYHLAARVTKLEAERSGRLPGLPHAARTDVPQILGQPGGVGRPAARVAGGGGGVRLLHRADASGSPSAPSTIDQGFTRKQHPLDVIGSSGRRG